MNYWGFSIEPFCSDVCEDHRCPQTLAEICRNMGICCGFRAVAARGKYPGFILLDIIIVLLIIYLTIWTQGAVGIGTLCVSKLSIIGSDNGLSPDRRQASIWTNAWISLIGHLGTIFSEILIRIQTFSFKKMCLKTSSAEWRPLCLGLNVLIMFST